MKKILKNHWGMSLIEIMVSFSILVLVFVSLAQTFPFALTINKTAENSTKAAYLVQAKLEELNSLGYANIPLGTIEAKHRLAANPNNYLYYFQRQTAVEYVDSALATSVSETGLKKVTVTVYYTNALSKTEKIYTTSTLISQW
ncbi:MAG: hypothetical protein PHS62_01160 [Patescibacteria group bacterium]|nr:hypothetical protein [Patescibacteria group bacterium]